MRWPAPPAWAGCRRRTGAGVAQRQCDAAHQPGWARLLTTVIPLTGPDQRQVAALLALQDVSVQPAREQRSAWLLVLGVLVVLLGMGTLVFVYLRGAPSPLQRSVDVLGALAQGDLRATLDDADEAQEEEAGRIARGVATLRLEL